MSEELEMIDGTGCAGCYAVFAKSEEHKIAIKPLLEINAKATFIGFRIRAVTSNTDLDFTNGNGIAEAFPGFTFQNKGSKRCSLVGGVVFNRGKYKADEVVLWMDDNEIVHKIIDKVKEGLQGLEFISEDLINQFLTDHYVENLSLYVDNEPELPIDDNPVISMSDYKDQLQKEEDTYSHVNGPVENMGYFAEQIENEGKESLEDIEDEWDTDIEDTEDLTED